jgi:undecaprenyl-diphosphatase
VSLWLAIVLGVVEGITEFLPISSTGHLILVSHLAGLKGRRAEVFEIFIQLGAVLAVVAEYRSLLGRAARDVARRPEARGLLLVLLAGFLPAGLAGLVLHRAIADHLFHPAAVAAALAAGAGLIFWVEGRRKSPRIRRIEDVTPGTALGIGLGQCAALWPGFSRSAATILAGLLAGLDRRTATEFSFLLAIPTLGSATLYELARNADALEAGDPLALAVAFSVSFGVAWAAVRWLLKFVSTHDLKPFAWYRLALAAVVVGLIAKGR